MQPASMQHFLSLILIAALHVSVPVDCAPRPRDPEKKSSFNRRTHEDTPSGTGRFYLELSGSMGRGIQRHLLVVLPVRTETSNFVSIFDLRRKRFLCMDSRGELHHSRQKDKEECLFQRLWLAVESQQDVFYSMTGGRLLKLEGAEQRDPNHEESEPSTNRIEKFLSPLVKRQRRSEEVNPSDPLRSESHPKDHKDKAHSQPDQDQTGAVSKETITSCDDPLRVLQPNGPVSPVKTNIADRAEQD